jgi:hypothetical protein
MRCHRYHSSGRRCPNTATHWLADARGVIMPGSYICHPHGECEVMDAAECAMILILIPIRDAKVAR